MLYWNGNHYICAPRAPIRCHAVSTLRARRCRLAQHDTANEAIVLDEAGNKLGELLTAVGVLILVFSLTKYSVIFTEVEGDFAKFNNQLK